MLLEDQAAQALITQGKTLTLAESCTGGLLSHRLTNIAGSSNFLKCGIVTYSNEAKAKMLKIDPKVITKHGAVSEEVASLMAKRARSLFKTDFAIAISGIAGPTGGTKRKPVGLTFISISTKDESLTLKCLFKGSREKIKSQAADTALELLLEFT